MTKAQFTDKNPSVSFFAIRDPDVNHFGLNNTC